MKAAIEAWWRQLSLRERRLVAVMLVLLVVVISWLGVVSPIRTALANTAARQAQALTALADVRAAARDLERLVAWPMLPPDEPLMPIIDRLAAEAGITLERLEGQGADRVALSVAAVRAPTLLGWLQQLEMRQGLAVDGFVANRNADNTIAAQVTLRRPVR